MHIVHNNEALRVLASYGQASLDFVVVVSFFSLSSPFVAQPFALVDTCAPSPSFTGFYWILPSFTGFYRVSGQVAVAFSIRFPSIFTEFRDANWCGPKKETPPPRGESFHSSHWSNSVLISFAYNSIDSYGASQVKIDRRSLTAPIRNIIGRLKWRSAIVSKWKETKK